MIDVTKGLDDTLVMLKHRIGDGVVVKREYGADVPQIEAVPSELNQVWTNLITNAIDAVDGKGTIHRDPRRTRVRGGRDRRRRPWHAARRAGACVRAVLHDQGRRQGHRARSRHLAADRRRPPPRSDHDRLRTGDTRDQRPPPAPTPEPAVSTSTTRGSRLPSVTMVTGKVRGRSGSYGPGAAPLP